MQGSFRHYPDCWACYAADLETFVKENGHARPKSDSALGRWQAQQRKAFLAGSFDAAVEASGPSKVARLNACRFVWEPLQADWLGNLLAWHACAHLPPALPCITYWLMYSEYDDLAPLQGYEERMAEFWAFVRLVEEGLPKAG